MDLNALAAKLTPRTRIVFFCSPHNPGGTIWSVEEIRALATFCAERDLVLVSDEIHCDLLFGGARHTPTLTAAPEIADRLITCVAATKTFNLAGAHVGACFASNPALKQRLDARIERAAPGARSMRLDATYLAWVDFSGTGLAPAEIAARVKDRARIFASPGEQFGPGGETWLRFNFATPRPILEAALDRLDDAFRELRT